MGGGGWEGVEGWGCTWRSGACAAVSRSQRGVGLGVEGWGVGGGRVYLEVGWLRGCVPAHGGLDTVHLLHEKVAVKTQLRLLTLQLVSGNLVWQVTRESHASHTRVTRESHSHHTEVTH